MNSPQDEQTSQYISAFGGAKRAKNVCLFAIILTLALQGASFVAVRFFGVIDVNQIRPPTRRELVAAGQGGPGGASATSAPAARPQGQDDRPNDDETRGAIVWQRVMDWVLHATKILTPIFTMLLLISILMAVCLSLLGRLGGIDSLVGAFFWAAVLLALVMPWQQILLDRFATGAMYDLNELIADSHKVMTAWGAAAPTWQNEVLYYVRFAGLPGIAFIAWLIVAVKFACGCRGVAGDDE